MLYPRKFTPIVGEYKEVDSKSTIYPVREYLEQHTNAIRIHQERVAQLTKDLAALNITMIPKPPMVDPPDFKLRKPKEYSSIVIEKMIYFLEDLEKKGYIERQ